MEPEWHIANPEQPLEQGDILLSRDPRNPSSFTVNVIITADCDIENSKFGSHLASLRTVKYSTYIRTVWSKKKLDRLINNSATQLRGQLSKWNSLRLSKKSEISLETTVNWIRRSTPDKICSDLQLPPQSIAPLEKALQKFKSAIEESEEGEADEFTKLVRFYSIHENKDPAISKTKFLEEARGYTLPEDIFFLPSLPRVDDEPYLVLLRELVPIAAESIATSALDATTEEQLLRIGRLKPDFKYALSQAFGSLYSRIGLPRSYDLRKTESIVTALSSTWPI